MFFQAKFGVAAIVVVVVVVVVVDVSVASIGGVARLRTWLVAGATALVFACRFLQCVPVAGGVAVQRVE